VSPKLATSNGSDSHMVAPKLAMCNGSDGHKIGPTLATYNGSQSHKVAPKLSSYVKSSTSDPKADSYQNTKYTCYVGAIMCHKVAPKLATYNGSDSHMVAPKLATSNGSHGHKVAPKLSSDVKSSTSDPKVASYQNTKYTCYVEGRYRDHEVASKYSVDDVYTLIKECNMDPSEATQRLSYIVVKKKKDAQKIVIIGKSDNQWRGASRRNFHPSKVFNGSGGRNLSSGGVTNNINRAIRPLPVDFIKESNLGRMKTSAANVNGKLSTFNGSDSHKVAPKLATSNGSDSHKVAPKLATSNGSHSHKVAPKLATSNRSHSYKVASKLSSDPKAASYQNTKYTCYVGTIMCHKVSPKLATSNGSDSHMVAPKLAMCNGSDGHKIGPTLATYNGSQSHKVAPKLSSDVKSSTSDPKAASYQNTKYTCYVGTIMCHKVALKLATSNGSDNHMVAPKLATSNRSHSHMVAPKLATSNRSHSHKVAPKLATKALFFFFIVV
nr:hypothetical protein [Tanacetum cinerariifolium]